MLYTVVLHSFIFWALVCGQNAPPLTKSIPLNPHDQYCPTDQSGCASIGEPTWCCPSSSRCTFMQGGSVACCTYDTSCADEEGGENPSPNQSSGSSGSSSSATIITQVSGPVETIETSNGNTIVFDPTTNVQSTNTNVNDNGAATIRLAGSQATVWLWSICTGFVLACLVDSGDLGI